MLFSAATGLLHGVCHEQAAVHLLPQERLLRPLQSFWNTRRTWWPDQSKACPASLLSSVYTHFGTTGVRREVAYTKTHKARSVPMSETLTATLKRLKISAATDAVTSVFGYRQMTKAFARYSLQVIEK